MVKIGNEYVVKVGEQGLLRLSSRRRAFRLLLNVLEREAEAEISRAAVASDIENSPDAGEAPRLIA